MHQVTISSSHKSRFNFRYLPAYADYLLKNHLEEFVIVSIRFARELQIPLMKPISKVPEEHLVKSWMESNRSALQSLRDGTTPALIETTLANWLQNKLNLIDKYEVEAEDLTLVYHLRRKVYAHFLYGYTQSAPIQQLITSEVDVYTSMEQLYALKVYLMIRHERESNG